MLKMALAFCEDIDYTDRILEQIKDAYAIEEPHFDWGTCYDVTLQDLRFRCVYSDDEMRGIIRTCENIIRELIDIQDKGYTRERFDNVDHFDNGGVNDRILSPLEVFTDFRTDKLLDYIAELAGYTRVAGAQYMLLAAPDMKSAIYGVFDKMLDDPEEVDAWFSCLGFLIKAAMSMHRVEVLEGAEEKTE